MFSFTSVACIHVFILREDFVVGVKKGFRLVLFGMGLDRHWLTVSIPNSGHDLQIYHIWNVNYY